MSSSVKIGQIITMFQNLFYQLHLKSIAATFSLGQVKFLLRLGSLIFFMVIATACRGGPEAPPATATPAGSNTGDEAIIDPTGATTPTAIPTPEAVLQLDNPFVVHVGQSATLEDEAVKITFASVLRDIRCPSKVECSEKGFARIQIEVQVADQEPASHEMNTEPFFKAEMKLGVNKITHEGYDIQLAELKPYPEYPDDKLDPAAYEATFIVSKAGK